MAPALDTAPAKKKSKLVPMVINEGTSMAYTVMYDPENNKVVSDNSALSNMMTSNIDAERETLEAANQQYRQNTVVAPYQESEQKMKVANDKFNLAQQSSPYLEEYTDASNEAKAILENDVEPNAVDGVLNASNTYRQAPYALDVFEQDGLDRKQGAEEYLGEDMMASVNAFNATDSAVIPTQGMALEQEMPTGARLDPYMEIPSTKDGYHRMPDGTLMADSEMEPDGVLGNNNEPKPKPKAVLDTTSSNDRKVSAVSSNARGSMMPFSKINRNEALIRIGGAMVGGSSQGFSGAMKAATGEYGNIQDTNRQAETDAFKNTEATRLAEARIQAQRDKADKNKKAMGMPSAVYKQAALTAITDIKGRLANESAFNPFDNNTGLFGYAMSHVAGTDAHDTANAIDTIEASIGFDRLQKMRDDSPTGGALGQVSNIELALLRKSLGSLKQSSSRAQFVKNLNSIETQYKKAVAAVEAQQREWYRMQGVDVPEPKNNSAEPVVVDGYQVQQTKK